MAAGRGKSGRAWRGWIALTLAYALVGQLVLASSAIALTVGPGRDGDFRILFCNPGGGAAPGQAPSGGHLPVCCALGCGFLNAFAPTPPGGGLAGPVRAFVRLARQGLEARLPPLRSRWSAHLARAPPAFAA